MLERAAGLLIAAATMLSPAPPTAPVSPVAPAAFTPGPAPVPAPAAVTVPRPATAPRPVTAAEATTASAAIPPAAPAPAAAPSSASKPERRAEPKAARKHRAASRDVEAVGRDEGKIVTSAPSLTVDALRAELGHTGAAGEAPLPAMSERARLEALGVDISRAREALKADTARLEVALKLPHAGDVASAADGRPAVRPAAGGLRPDSLRGQIEIVARAIAGMKPEPAAAILTHVDRVLAADILRRMKAADAGAVMAQLKPEIAAEIATEIAIRLPRLEPPKEKP
jgi:flagellar motility protein MotE (MotC chaperone)